MKKRILFLSAAILVAGSAVMAQDYKVLTDKSVLRWTGKKPTKSHTGVIQLKEGSLTVKKNQITGGTFVIDMNTMVEGDGSDPNKGARLIGHLKSDDFFSTDKFATSTLVIKEATPFVKDEATITGDLTIKGITHPVTFKAKKIGDAYQASVSFDRSLYDVRFGSGKFFNNLGDNAIDDMIVLDVTVVTVKK
jgi:polyisoprenoid-binding protein YceI